ncbi:MAG: hypothetical protein BEU05_00045 [Marine Group III euryarchaeote CG-Bathy2]|nr:(S)-2,3-di-O-geranylgeranylglyceryl phosphate synthase (ubiA) [uncultured marine group II/III euryarchaeote KM3_45_C02]OIR13062.1 MAG: hypothetical protein BEU05_00045 [Marine Group III euryarchaeote CG-Bathy2]
MNPYLEITRPANCVLTAVAVAVGAFVAVGPELAGLAVQLALGCGAAMACVAGGNALNDWFDREGDRANHPQRPLPSGRLQPAAALRWALALLATGLGALAAGWQLDALGALPLAIAGGGCLLLGAYETALKASGLPGNALVALLSGAVFLYGGSLTGDPGPALWLFTLAVLASVAREIVKDVQDLAGDRDRRTLPATIGTPRALALAAVALLVAVILSFRAAAGFDGDARSGYLVLVAAADAVMLYGLWLAWRGDARAGQKLLKQGMWVAMAAFIVGAGL